MSKHHNLCDYIEQFPWTLVCTHTLSWHILRDGSSWEQTAMGKTASRTLTHLFTLVVTAGRTKAASPPQRRLFHNSCTEGNERWHFSVFIVLPAKLGILTSNGNNLVLVYCSQLMCSNFHFGVGYEITNTGCICLHFSPYRFFTRGRRWDAQIDAGHYPFPILSTQTLQKFNSSELFWLFFILSQRQQAHDLLYLFVMQGLTHAFHLCIHRVKKVEVSLYIGCCTTDFIMGSRETCSASVFPVVSVCCVLRCVIFFCCFVIVFSLLCFSIN